MNFKKSLLVICLVMCILFTVSGVSAGDVNDTAIASEDTIDSSEDLALSVEESPADDDISDGTLAVSEIDENESVCEIADESVVSVSSDEDILSAKDYKVTVYKETGKFNTDKKVYLRVTDAKTGKPVKFYYDNLEISVYDYDSVHTSKGFVFNDLGLVFNAEISTNSHGIGVLDLSDENLMAGAYIIRAGVTEIGEAGYTSNVLQKKIIIYKNNVKIKAKKLTVPKNSKKKFLIRVIGQNNKPVNKALVKIVVYTGNKYIVKNKLTNSKGYATFDGVSKLSEGTHKVIMSLGKHRYLNDGLYSKKVTSYIIVGKASASAQTSGKTGVTIKAKGLSAQYKSGKYFAAKVVKTSNGAPLKGIPVNVIIYTGNSYKAVTLKTTSKGNIAYSTGKLSVGTHKVVLKIKNNKRYAGKAVTTAIKITKKSSSSSTPSGGKLRTTLTVNDAYRSEYSGYNFKVTLKDSKGKKLANRQIEITTTMYLGGGSFKVKDTFTTDSNGVAEGYVSSMFGGITAYDATFRFAGDRGHYATTANKYIG